MSRRYPPEQKAEALNCLLRNKCNTKLTAAQTGVPVRTLRTWWREARVTSYIARLQLPDEAEIDHAGVAPTEDLTVGAALSSLGLPVPPTSLPGLPHFENDLSALTYLRTQILDELLSSPQDWRGSLALMSPYQRSQIAIMLLDRLLKLDEHLKPYRPQPIERHYVVGSEGEEPDGPTDTARSAHPSEGNS